MRIKKTQKNFLIRTILLAILLVLASVSIFYLGSVVRTNAPYRRLTEDEINKISMATLNTNFGEITIQLNSENMRTKENFVNLAYRKYYDGLRVHRIVPDFGIQTGDPFTRSTNTISEWGDGGPGYTLSPEIDSSDIISRGVVIMAADGLETHGSQFIIITKDSHWLNGYNTILGTVTSGMDVVDSISHTPSGVTGIPSGDVLVVSVKLK